LAVAVLLSAPAVPAKVTVDDRPAAAVVAVMITLWGVPGVRVRVDGLALTPEGRPASETVTG
jgi:hypothetical protein